MARAQRIQSARGKKLLKKRLHVRERKPMRKPKTKVGKSKEGLKCCVAYFRACS